MSQKSYDNSPCLYLIPTPIGNMEDITIRTINILSTVEVIFSEDTRVTGLLLNHLGIKKKMIANHKYNEVKNGEKLISYLSTGKSVGLVSDRGTPVISDPGFDLSKVAIENGYNVVALPGPTAFVCALITSGLDASSFSFIGFLDSKKSSRMKQMEFYKNRKETLIFYESPHRIKETMEDFLNVMGNRGCSISREITKKFEEVYRGKISDVILEISNIRGEIVIVIEGDKSVIDYSKIEIVEHVNSYIHKGLSLKESIKQVAKDRGVIKNDIYMHYHGNTEGK